MKHLAFQAALTALVFCASGLVAKSTLITNFGTDADDESSGWTYNPATSTLSGTESVGSYLVGVNIPYSFNLTGATGLQLVAKVTTNPFSSFTVTLEDDSASNKVAIATWTWASFMGPDPYYTVYVPFTSVTPGFNYANVQYWSLESGSSGNAINATLVSLTAIPEPQTFALLAVGLGALVIMRQRRKVA